MIAYEVMLMEKIGETVATMTSDMASRVPTEYVPFVFVLLVLLIFVCVIFKIMQKIHKNSLNEIRNAYNSSIRLNQETIEDLRATLENERADYAKERENYIRIIQRLSKNKN
ncbi:MAG: hypothetical protein LKJ13_02325 [Clostridia bacterium]|nr:hypothetical protein [Clostridia bacterium]MCI2001144.1 hypothetical protein [Clostridia bacterium]MCI2015834.1 hypothetical protein [Clostridia bacterium]